MYSIKPERIMKMVEFVALAKEHHEGGDIELPKIGHWGFV